MFNFIIGKIEEKQEGIVILNNNDIGYELNVSNNTLCSLPDVNEIVKLYTYFQIREDGISLFGFSSIEEKRLFLQLITVSGVGPKMAISILSGARLSDIGVSIVNGDISLLSKIKGCGKKTAERIIVELRDKIDAFGLAVDTTNQVVVTNVDSGVISDAVETLMSLGINRNEATRLVKLVMTDSDTVEDIISKVLRNMG